MKSNGESSCDNELIVTGIILIVLGIAALATTDQETRLKIILFSYLGPLAGIIAVIFGVAQKFRKQ